MTSRAGSEPRPGLYLPAARLCQRVAFSIFLCFFLRIRFRRFFISEPMSDRRLVVVQPSAPRTTDPSDRATGRRSQTGRA